VADLIKKKIEGKEFEGYMIEVHAPTLVEDMTPAYKLFNMECPRGQGYNAECFKCDVGVIAPDFKDSEGAVFAHMKYPAFCANRNDVEFPEIEVEMDCRVAKEVE